MKLRTVKHYDNDHWAGDTWLHTFKFQCCQWAVRLCLVLSLHRFIFAGRAADRKLLFRFFSSMADTTPKTTIRGPTALIKETNMVVCSCRNGYEWSLKRHQLFHVTQDPVRQDMRIPLNFRAVSIYGSHDWFSGCDNKSWTKVWVQDGRSRTIP